MTGFHEWPNCGRGLWTEMTQVLYGKGVPEMAGFKNRPNRPRLCAWKRARVQAARETTHSAGGIRSLRCGTRSSHRLVEELVGHGVADDGGDDLLVTLPTRQKRGPEVNGGRVCGAVKKLSIKTLDEVAPI